jgi:AcrR family transcriptional regulator
MHGVRRSGRPTREEAAQIDLDLREAALRVFLDHGYEGASVAAMASAAGTTKASLYARYASKEQLFVAVFNWATQRTDWPFPQADPPDFDDLDGALTAIATDSQRRALDPSMVKLSRIAISQAERFPDIARNAATSPRQQLVVDVLKHHVANGEIVADDVDILAEHFIAMVAGMPARLASMGIVRGPEVQRRRLEVAVQLFVRGLRPS